MSSYKIKEIFYSIQGEGYQAGRPAIFCRFSGCNLWSGREIDRDTAICRFCDTDFVRADGVNGGIYKTSEELVLKTKSLLTTSSNTLPLLVFTGGEPLLQLNEQLIATFHNEGFELAIETNGTLPLIPGLDWICVSPKANAPLLIESGNEIKLVYPQAGIKPGELENLDFEHFFLQPMDGPDLEKNTEQALKYCMENPKWKLSLQLHKILGLP